MEHNSMKTVWLLMKKKKSSVDYCLSEESIEVGNLCKFRKEPVTSKSFWQIDLVSILLKAISRSVCVPLFCKCTSSYEV